MQFLFLFWGKVQCKIYRMVKVVKSRNIILAVNGKEDGEP
jgi:hypothetical protein